MQQQGFWLDGRRVTVYGAPAPRILFLQPVDEHDGALPDSEAAAMEDCPLPFALAAFSVEDRNRELSPWEAPPVFGKVPFGGGPEDTLRFVERLLPVLRARLAPGDDVPVCLGG